jgi:hypothetical protein
LGQADFNKEIFFSKELKRNGRGIAFRKRFPGNSAGRNVGKNCIDKFLKIAYYRSKRK